MHRYDVIKKYTLSQKTRQITMIVICASFLLSGCCVRGGPPEASAVVEVQEASESSQVHSGLTGDGADRMLHEDDFLLANFRSVKAGDISENMLYRSASPCDSDHHRAACVDALAAGAGVAYILDLADNEEKIREYLNDPDFASPYYRGLYEAGNVFPLALSSNYSSDAFKKKVAEGLANLAEHPGPWLIHCTWGRTRTGFVCMLLEALCGASYDEIVRDYMITYDNYDGINRETDPDRYDDTVHRALEPMLRVVIGDETGDPRTADLSAYAERYLRDGGMPAEQIGALKRALTGSMCPADSV